MVVDRQQARGVAPVLVHIPAVHGLRDEVARVVAEPGEQREFLAAHEYVHAVDLHHTDRVEHPAQVAGVDPTGGAWCGETLRGHRNAAG